MYLRTTTFILSILCLGFAKAQQSQLNDEFNSPCNLANWQNITDVEGWTTPGGDPAEHLEEHDISATYPGELYMMPYSSSWYQNWRGVLIFKEITGDFVITSRITVTRRNGLALPPTSAFSLAGIMIRTPTNAFNPPGDTTGIQNYIFSAIGNARSNGQFQLEIKTTTNSGSSLIRPNIGSSNQIYMRVIKKGPSIVVLSSFDNVSWTFRSEYHRPDFLLSDHLQLGFVTYTDWDIVRDITYPVQNVNILNDAYNAENGTSWSWNPDLIGRFDFARFEELNLPAQFENANLINDFTPTELVDLFNHPSVPTYPTGSKIWNGSNDSNWTNADNWNGGIPIVGDHVVIPNCSCPEVEMPILPASTPTFSGMHLEEGASLNIPIGITLNIDLVSTDAVFVNEGSIENFGSIVITNASGKTVKTVSVLNNNPGSSFSIE